MVIVLNSIFPITIFSRVIVAMEIMTKANDVDVDGEKDI